MTPISEQEKQTNEKINAVSYQKMLSPSVAQSNSMRLFLSRHAYGIEARKDIKQTLRMKETDIAPVAHDRSSIAQSAGTCELERGQKTTIGYKHCTKTFLGTFPKQFSVG